MAALEFALVATPLLMLTIGLIDYGFIFLNAQQITQAARHGARAAALADSTNAKVNVAIDALLTDAGIAPSSVVRVITPGDVSTVTPGTAIKVELTVPTDQLVLINTSLIPVPLNLRAAASMAKEGT